MYKKVICGLCIVMMGLVRGGITGAGPRKQQVIFYTQRNNMRNEALKSYGETNNLKILTTMPTDEAAIDLSEFQSYEQTKTELTAGLQKMKDKDILKQMVNQIMDRITSDRQYAFTLKIQGAYFECSFVTRLIEGTYGPNDEHSLSWLAIRSMYVPNIDSIDWTKVMNTLIVVIRYITDTIPEGTTDFGVGLFWRILDNQESNDKTKHDQIKEKLKAAYDQIKETKEFKILTQNTYAGIYAVNRAGEKVVQAAQFVTKTIGNKLGITPYKGS